MKKLRLLIIVILSLIKSSIYAYDFEVDGFYYNRIPGTSNKVEITYKTSTYGDYSGQIFIPETCEYQGKLYYVTTIGNRAFYGSAIDFVYIPPTITSIGEESFRGCSLKSVTLPNSIESIGSGAFYRLRYGFTTVKSKIQNPMTIDIHTFSRVNQNVNTLYVPYGTKSLYGLKWKPQFETIIECPEEVDIKITSRGNGYTYYNTINLRNHCHTTECELGKNFTIEFEPDNGYRIKRVKVNNSDVTSYIVNNQYTISNVSANTNVEVEFEAIPPTTYTLSIKATGNGSATYNSTTIKNKTQSFTVNEGTSATITFTPDAGYRIKSVKVNSTDVTSSVSNNSYTINSITANTTLEVEFEAIPPTTYTLSIKATGNGSASYGGTTIRSKTSSFTVNEGTSATISFTPDDGYRIKSVKVNSTDVTSSVSNNSYTISSISSNTMLEVEFEAIPPTTYTLSIKATGNGSATYNSTTIKNKTQSFTINEGTSATISFTPDNGYRIKSVKVNSTDVTSNVTNKQYTISNISSDTTLEVEFEAIPLTTYTLSIKATGNGTASYGGTTIRSKTSSFTVNEGTSATISFTPDSEYRIKNVKVNSTDVTSNVMNNQYTISSISANTTLEVEFEAIPPTMYTLSIKATGNGTASYGGTTIRSKTSSFTVNEGTSATISFTPDSGYRIKNVKVNSTDVTSNVTNNSYTISSISANTTLEVEFEAIPPTTYTLSIKATGNGIATYNGIEVRSTTKTFTVIEGTSATVSFSPDNGNSLNGVMVDGTDVTSLVASNRYTISNIKANATLEVTFIEDITAITVDGVNYKVVSQSDGTINLATGDYGKVLTVPSSVISNNKTWQVVGIEQDALKGNTELAAIIWNPAIPFNAEISNPNLLLYVKDGQYAPSTIQNIVANDVADIIVLTEANDNNNFYCPQTFTARQISYIHNFKMQTGVDESRGWETIALPFDVQTISHEGKGNIKAFANWKHGDTEKPFWLYELTGNGFVEASNIKANTPYVISMPNHPRYDNEWLLKGKVTFAASNVSVNKTEDIVKPTYGDRTFVPCFSVLENNAGVYALNVNNDYETNTSGMTEGSKFVLNMRKVHPFEAYMITTSNAPQYAIGIFDGMPTGIRTIEEAGGLKEEYYDLQGRKMNEPTKKGVYIKNRKKVIINKEL